MLPLLLGLGGPWSGQNWREEADFGHKLENCPSAVKNNPFGGKKAEIHVQANSPFSLPRFLGKSVLKRKQEHLRNELLGEFDADGAEEPSRPRAPR